MKKKIDENAIQVCENWETAKQNTENEVKEVQEMYEGKAMQKDIAKCIKYEEMMNEMEEGSNKLCVIF